MTSRNGSDSFFDPDGDQDQDPALALKGEYSRGSTPPSNKPDYNHSNRAHPASAGHSRSSTSGNFTAESDTMSRAKDSAKSYSDKSRSISRSPNYGASHSPRYSRSRSRSRSPSYSDSFNSEDSRQDSRRASPVRTKKSTRGRSTGATSNRYNSGNSKDSRSSYKSYGTSYAKSTRPVKKAPPKKGRTMCRSQSVTTLQQQSPRGTDVSRRMLSAKGHTINRLRSEVDELRRKYDDAVRENRLVQKLQKRQEAALSKFEDKDEELPRLLRNHAAEVDSLRERLRRAQEKDKDKDRRLRDRNEEMNRLNDELKKLRRISEDRQLLERDKLQRKVDKLNDGVDEKEKKINELERYLDNTKKNQRHETDQWRLQEKEFRARLAHLDDENQMLKYQLREKEKELDIRNIYSNRIMKPHTKLATSNSPPSVRRLSQTRATSNDELTKTRQAPLPTVKRSSSAEESKPDHTPREKLPVAVVPEVKKEPAEVEKKLSEHEKILQELDAGSKPLPPARKDEDDVLKQLDDGIKKRERIDEEERRSGERRKRREMEEQEQEQRRKREEEEEEERRKRDEERRRAEEERRRKEEEEKKAKERRKREEEVPAPVKSSTFIAAANASAPKRPTFGDHSSGDEGDIPFFGSTPKGKAAAPPPFQPGNGFAVNSVRDLHRYSSNARQGSGGNPDSRGEPSDQERKRREEEEERLVAQRRKQEEESERQRKDLLLAKLKEIDSGKPNSRHSKKDYKFTQPVENLHNGKPSHPDLLGSASSGGKKKPPADDDDSGFAGYAPSFGRRSTAGEKPPARKGGLFDDDDDNDDDDDDHSDDGRGEDFFTAPKPSQSDKKAKLISNLFGDAGTNAPTKGRSSLEGTVFSTSTKAKPVADSATLPWEKRGHGHHSGNLFTQANKPNSITVNAPKSSFDDFDDDIEEVVL